MKKDELRTEMKDMLVKAKENLSKDKYLKPVALIYTNNSMGVCPLNFSNEKQKDFQMLQIMAVSKTLHAEAVVLIQEAWIAQEDMTEHVRQRKNLTKKEMEEIWKDLSKEKRKRPSQRRDRRECILIIGECEEGKLSITQLFHRERSKIIFDKEEELEDSILKWGDFGISKKEDNPMYV